MGVPHIARPTVAAALSCVMLSGFGWPGHSRHPKSAPVKPVVAGPSVPPRQARVTAIDLSTFVTMREQGSVLVYDVRPSWLYMLGHIPGAESFPGRSFEEAFPSKEPAMKAALSSKRTIVIYCTDLKCPDGGIVAGWMSKKGIPVSVLSGGWEDWKAAGMPTE